MIHFGGAMLFARISIYLLSVFFLNISASRANSCRQVFNRSELPANFAFPEDLKALQAFQAAKEVVEGAGTRDQFVDALYLLATHANNVVDKVIDNIIIVEFRQLSQDKAAPFRHSSATLFNNLLLLTNLDFETLQQVVTIRYQEDKARLLNRNKRELQRAGFLGFIEHKTEESIAAKQETGTIGFDLGQNQDDALDEDDETMQSGSLLPPPLDQEGEKVSRGSFGFLTLNNSTDDHSDSTYKEKIGFIRFAEPDKEVHTWVRMTLNMQTGTFEVEKPMNPLGFEAP